MLRIFLAFLFLFSTGIALSDPVISNRACNNAVGYSNLTGASIDLSTTKYASAQFVWTGFTGVFDGTVRLQVSDSAGTAWEDKSGSVLTLGTANGVKTLSLTNVTEQFYRVVYTHNSVTGGVLNCYLFAKP